MKININTKNVDLNQQQKTQVFEKFDDIVDILKRFDPDEKIADVRVEKRSRWGYKISFSMWLPKKKHIYVEVKDKNFSNAIHKLKDLVVRQVTDYKDQLSKNRVDKEKFLEKLEE